MQGRERETEWDTVLDDREFDIERKMRDGWEKGNQWLEREPVYELDVRLRARLGIARLWMGENGEWVEEAKRHFDLMLEEDVASFPELFDAVGDAYCEKGMYEKALEMFAVMAECEEVSYHFARTIFPREGRLTDSEETHRPTERTCGSRLDSVILRWVISKKLENVSRMVGPSRPHRCFLASLMCSPNFIYSHRGRTHECRGQSRFGENFRKPRST